MWSFEEVFFVVAGRLPVTGPDRKLRWLWGEWRNFLLILLVFEDSVAVSVFDILIVVLVVVVEAHNVVGAFVIGARVVIEDHSGIC